jgi:hypothetical protein
VLGALATSGRKRRPVRARLVRAFGFSSSLSTIMRADCSSETLRGAGVVVQDLDGGVAKAALGHIDDALEGEIVGWLTTQRR